MLDLFKPIPIYIRVYTDRMEMTRLDTNETISRTAENKFSNQRLVIADFYNAEELARSMLKELLHTTAFFQRQLSVLVQQMEKCEGGLSVVERRVLYDLGERCDARYVKHVDHNRVLSVGAALEYLADQ